MTFIELFILAVSGLFAGVLAGFLGIGGGTILVPLLVTLGYEPIQAVATSTLSIIITATSGSIQNWKMGYLSISRVLGIGFAALITAQLGVYFANLFASRWLLFAFGLFLALNIYLVEFRKRITMKKKQDEELQNNQQENLKVKAENTNNQDFVVEFILPFTPHPLPLMFEKIVKEINYQFPDKYMKVIARVITGSLAGLLAGVFGVGGGVIIVPLQILLLGESIKVAIQTSLGVIVITAFSACIGHGIRGNVLWEPGALLGFGGLLGVQFSTRFLPKLPDKVISLAFRGLLAILSIYIFGQAIIKN
ncbi:MAG: sulfite exporter TauE/SafE family protein [Okeania sp. SIO2C2]|uniref:sulfite exporter TauE/SafE family protein n=1 Tax=Okeania sp. SIO2C2 TaxID=2607787 RepID=UPI0013B9BD33|nr:sulfite exporter TauE/SafE family protein [Okeania sp. SIO2C2]NEP87207.1 sulfite exporter TauE/SafE family protein [Okeania sp. SIO2C2]